MVRMQNGLLGFAVAWWRSITGPASKRASTLRGLSAQLEATRAEHALALKELAAQLESTRAEHASALKALGACIERGNKLCKLDSGELYREALRSVGVLNYENDEVSGERRFLQRFCENFANSVVFDVGANRGQYSTLARRLGPRLRIFAFEPNPESFDSLSKIGAELNILALPIALGEKTSKVELWDYSDEMGSQHASLHREVIEGIHRRPAASRTVDCLTVDQIAQERGVERIGLLKIDTEGHELAVLKGAKRLLASGSIDVIQFEFNEMNVVSRVFLKDFYEILTAYRIYRLLPAGAIEFAVYDPIFMEVFAYQNIVCVRRDLPQHWIHAPDPAVEGAMTVK